MNLYKISQNVNEEFNTYRAAIVCAATEDDARNMHPKTGERIDWVKYAEEWPEWTGSPEQVSVELVGKAGANIPPGVVLFHFVQG